MIEPSPLRISKARALLVVTVLPWLVLLYLAMLAYSVLFRDAADPALLALHPLDLLPFLAIGFAAQLIDGSLGMGFGVISNAMLLAIGLPPAAATTGVHTAEGFASGASAMSHIWQRNVDWRLFGRLILPGLAGAVIGAVLITMVSAEFARPVVLGYLFLIGVYLLVRCAARPLPTATTPRIIQGLGFFGGLLDAAGGGGWGPIVTGNLLLQGAPPAKVIGTVSVSEFFVTITISAILVIAFGMVAFTVATTGLLIGGVAAAPLGAVIARRMPGRWLTGLAGALLLATSLFALVSGWMLL